MSLIDDVRKEYRDPLSKGGFYENMVRDVLTTAARSGKKEARLRFYDGERAAECEKYLKSEGFEVSSEDAGFSVIITAKF